MKILMHTCCAPCSTYCISELKRQNLEFCLYWYNPNIHPYNEYEKRLETLKKYAKEQDVKLIIKDEYGLEEFIKNVSGNINARCYTYCYKTRLEQTAKYAKENGFDAITTTLLVSPYQDHEYIKKMLYEIAQKYGLKVYYQDFRYGYYIGQEMARQANLYMQKYCGCIFSEAHMILAHTNDKPKLPEGFEFLPVKRSIVIKKEKNDKEKYIDLLLEADPSKEQINKYLNDSDLFVLTYKDDVACIAVVTKIDENTVELKNIATKKEYRGNGYGKKMIKYLADNYKTKYKKMLVGTTENNIPFYVKQGFDKYEKTIKNYFTDNYAEKIIDGDLHCIDIYYYSKELK